MAEMIPVGNSAQPINPLQSLSGILGIQQQQQNLETGALQQQTIGAEAQQAQQTTQQRQAAAQFFQNYDISKHIAADGTLDLDQALTNPQLRATGDAYPGIVQNLVDIKNKQLQAKQSLAGLNDTLRGQFSAMTSGLLSDPDVAAGNETGKGKMLDAITNWERVGGPDAQRVGEIYRPVFQNAPTGPSAPGQASKLAQVARNVGLQANSASEIAGRTTPNQQVIGQTVQDTNALSPTASVRPGGQVSTLNSAQQIPYVAAAASAQAGAATRASGQGTADVERANQVSDNVKSSVAGIQTTQQIDDLADQIHSGKYASWLSKQAAAIGLKEDTYARQLLEKDLGIVRTQLTAAAPSDARAATILSGTPDATSDPQTIHGAMDYVRGSMRQNVAQGQNLAAYRTKHPDLSGFQAADQAFTSGAGPMMHEFLSLKNQAQQSAFYKRNFTSPQEALQFRNNAYAASHALGLDQNKGPQ